MNKHAPARKKRHRKLFRTVEVPDNLEDVLGIDTAAKVNPALADHRMEAVETLWETCEKL
jgi:hypothetical protein